jgi:hypothetical protein
LKGILDKVRHTSFFGGDNRQAILGQIELLENRGEDFDSGYLDDSDFYDALLYAKEWLEGEDTAPSKDWEPLCDE